MVFVDQVEHLAARDDAAMVQKSIRAVSPGSSRTRRRKAKIGIEHSARSRRTAAARPSRTPRDRGAASAADEAGAIGLELALADGHAVDDRQVRRPDLRLVRRRAAGGAPAGRRSPADVRSR